MDKTTTPDWITPEIEEALCKVFDVDGGIWWNLLEKDGITYFTGSFYEPKWNNIKRVYKICKKYGLCWTMFGQDNLIWICPKEDK